MKKLLQSLLALIFIAFVTPASEPVQAVVTIEDGIIMGINLPAYGTICEDTDVRTHPYLDVGYNLYILHVGDIVRLREQSQDDDLPGQ
jgi:hypothetical protein